MSETKTADRILFYGRFFARYSATNTPVLLRVHRPVDDRIVLVVSYTRARARARVETAPFVRVPFGYYDATAEPFDRSRVVFVNCFSIVSVLPTPPAAPHHRSPSYLVRPLPVTLRG